MLSQNVVELWTLYSIGVATTLLRTYARWRAVGWKHFAADDYLIWVAIIFYSAQSALAYSVGSVANDLANSGMTDAQRAALPIDDPEYHQRVAGSKIQVAGWATYVALIGSLKLSMMAFYVRLTNGLSHRYRVPVWVGFALVIGSFLASIIVILAACRPFHNYWQIYPDPGNICQPAISKAFIWVTFIANIITDPYLIFIPIPMLWTSSLKLIKKIATTIVLSSGVFVLVCATLKSVFLITEPLNGAEIANAWGTRETFVAVVTTNLPMIFHLFRSWLTVIFGSRFQSTDKTSYKSPCIGGSDFTGRNYRSRRGPPNANPITNLTFSESKERIVEDIKMQNMATYSNLERPVLHGIVVSNQIEVTHETRE